MKESIRDLKIEIKDKKKTKIVSENQRNIKENIVIKFGVIHNKNKNLIKEKKKTRKEGQVEKGRGKNTEIVREIKTLIMIDIEIKEEMNINKHKKIKENNERAMMNMKVKNMIIIKVKKIKTNIENIALIAMKITKEGRKARKRKRKKEKKKKNIKRKSNKKTIKKRNQINNKFKPVKTKKMKNQSLMKM